MLIAKKQHFSFFIKFMLQSPMKRDEKRNLGIKIAIRGRKEMYYLRIFVAADENKHYV